MKKLLIAALLMFAVPALARVGADDWVVVPYNQNGLQINSRSVELKSGKMWIKIQVINNTGQNLIFNPDQIQAKLPDGRSVARDKGVADKHSSIHQGKLIAPGAAEEFAIEYQVGDPAKVALSLQTGVMVNAKPARFPDFVMTRPDKAWQKGSYSNQNIVVSLVSAMPTKKGIEVKLKINNKNEAPILIDKNRFKVKLPDGSLVDREKTLIKNVYGVFGKSEDELSLEFNCGNPMQFAIVMDGINNGELNLPDFPVNR